MRESFSPVDGRSDAIYARQSIDKIDSISIESQIERCKMEVIGDSIVYQDKGYSGKNTERPSFQKLSQHIREGKIKRVIVYRLDRISRSVLDFAELIQTFQQYNVEFVSTMEKFDTSSPVGKAMLIIIMVFAQLERETIQQRIIDAYRSRSRRGFYMGGRVPYGYRLTDIKIDHVRTKMYEAIPEEMVIVQKAFSIYAQPQASLGDVVNFFSAHGIYTRLGKDFNRSTVRDILINPIYVKSDAAIYDFFLAQGANLINDRTDFIGQNGAYLYSDEERKHYRSTEVRGLLLVLAPHRGFIDSDTWLRCRKKCMKNQVVAKPTKAKTTWLAGKLKCGLCGYALVGKKEHYKDRIFRYYLCSHKYTAHACSFTSIDANELDALVFAEMQKKIRELSDVPITDHQCQQQIAQLKSEIDLISSQINALLEKIPEASPSVMKYINEKISELDQTKNSLLHQFETSSTPCVADMEVENVSHVFRQWDSFHIMERITIVDSLIEKVIVTPEKMEILWRF